MHLPKNSIKYYVLSIKQWLYTLYPIPHTQSQTGFAIIPLLILLVVGITAGTLLVQNRTNFLPQAADPTEGYFNCTPDRIGEQGIKEDGTPSCKKINFSHCDVFLKDSGEQLVDPSRLDPKNRSHCDAYAEVTSNFVTNYHCYWDPPQCLTTSQTCSSVKLTHKDKEYTFPQNTNRSLVTTNVLFPTLSFNLDNQLHTGTTCMVNAACQLNCARIEPNTPTAADPAQGAPVQAGKCLLRQVRIPGSSNREDVTIEPGPAKEYCDVYNRMYSYRCEEGVTYPTAVPAKDSQCTPATQPAPAAAPATGTPQKIQAKTCSPTTPAPDKTIGCYLDSENKQRWMFETKNGGIKCSTTPTNDENRWCKTQGSPDGCETVDAILIKDDKSETPVQFTRCIPPKAGSGQPSRPAAGAPAAGTTANARPGAQPAAGATNPRPAAGTGTSTTAQGQTNVVNTNRTQEELICGKDTNNLNIPCYAIGVFSPQELTSREAQTKIAAINYEKFRTILKEQEEKIGKEIAANAEKKIAEAEGALKACMQ